MTTARLILSLGVFMIAIALFGSYRTGSLFPILIMGSIGIITLVLGLFYSKGNSMAGKILFGWLALNMVIEGYQAFWHIPAHPESRPGSSLIFGSVALFSLITLVVMLIRQNRLK